MQTIDELIERQGHPPSEAEGAGDQELLNDSWVESGNPFPSLAFPPGPEHIQQDWGPLPTKREYRKAHALWSRPNNMLDAPDDAPYSDARTEATEFLTRNVYAHLEARGFDLPPTEDEWEPQAQFRFEAGDPALWTYEELGCTAPNRRNVPVDEMLISGKRNRYHLWTVELLRNELKARELLNRAKKEKWLKQRMIDELFAYEQGRPDQDGVEGELCLRQSLGRWGIERGAQDITACQDQNGRLSPLHLYTWALHLSPYNPTYWISRAYLFYQQGYFDLAIGDTFRALYLVETLTDKTKRSITPGLYIRVWDAIEQHILANREADAGWDSNLVFVELKKPDGLIGFVPHLERTSYHILSLSLIGLQAWSDWANVERSAIAKMKRTREYIGPFHQRWRNLRDLAFLRYDARVHENERWKHESTAGAVCGRLFPQSAGDVRRTTEVFCARLNAECLALQPKRENGVRNVEVREKKDGELGVFSLRAFQPGEIIYTEIPSARGILKQLSLFDSSRAKGSPPCENCKRPILMDATYLEDGRRLNKQQLRRAAGQGHNSICDCVTMEPDILWCGNLHIDKAAQENETAPSTSAPNAPETRAPVDKNVKSSKIHNTRGASKGARALRGTKRKRSQKSPSPSPSSSATPNREIDFTKTCLERARQQYHFHSCGANWSWLHRGMQQKALTIYIDDNERENLQEKDDFEEHGTVLSLLLREIFDATLLKHTNAADNHILPHEIDAMLPLCGAEDMPGRYFPFGYSANIVVPFNILLNLGVDIFKKFEFDTWIIQTVLRKLLMNCVPWDQELRGGQRMQPPTKPSKPGIESPPTFENLYLHTSFAMFNHACTLSANAEWCWGEWSADQGYNSQETPTRITVKTRQTIAPDEEIRIQYYPGIASLDEQIRLFGQQCDCSHCQA